MVTISEVRAKPLPTPVEGYSADLGALARLDSAVPIRAGRDEASVTVKMVWHLE